MTTKRRTSSKDAFLVPSPPDNLCETLGGTVDAEGHVWLQVGRQQRFSLQTVEQLHELARQVSRAQIHAIRAGFTK